MCGRAENEHDYNIKRFMAAQERKVYLSSKFMKLLGYSMANNMIKSDPDRLKPLMDLPIPRYNLFTVCFKNVCTLLPLNSQILRKDSFYFSQRSFSSIKRSQVSLQFP